MNKPCQLQLNTSGAWKTLAHFDAADDERSGELMDAAAQFIDTVNQGADKRAHSTLRIVTADDGLHTTLMRYDTVDRAWRDAVTGEVA
jgi:hypothetical protein